MGCCSASASSLFLSGDLGLGQPIWLRALSDANARHRGAFHSTRRASFRGVVTLIAPALDRYSLGGYGPAAAILGLFFILGLVAAPFLPETNGKPLPETLSPPCRRGRIAASKWRSEPGQTAAGTGRRVVRESQFGARSNLYQFDRQRAFPHLKAFQAA